MDVVRIGTGPRRWLSLGRFAQVCWFVAAPLVFGGCSDTEVTTLTLDPAHSGQTGSVEFNLVGQGSRGTQFRLRDAVVTVQGPDQTLFFDSEDDPDATRFSAVVSPGIYTSFLQEGWHLERVDSGKAVADAVLLSPNPENFEVFEGQLTHVALRFRAGSDTITPGSLEIVIEVEEQGPASDYCSTDADCAGGAVCCVSGFLGTCQPREPGAACPLPDLTVSGDVAAQSVVINQEYFPPNSCAIEEGCVAGSGTRRLLRFSTMTPNVGEADLILGDPTSVPGFEFAPCHNHFHFNGYARYELLDPAGAVVAVGHKQAFCLLDSVPVGIPGAPTASRFHCGFQGLTRGWADIYDAGLDCQWVDITDVPDGEYLLRISINPDRVIDESNYDNNTAEVPVTIAPAAPVDPLSTCAVQDSGVLRECGWSLALDSRGKTCKPGEPVGVGCGCSNPVACAGDPMIRVCDGTEACGVETSLSFVDDTCGLCPELEFICPESGVYSVLTSSYTSGAPYSCEIETR